MKIQETKDYSKFSLLSGNRPIKHRPDLEMSISKYGVMVPIAVTPSLEIIDGQHRYYYAKELNLTLPYFVTTKDKHDFMIQTNSNQKNWSLQDHISKHAEDDVRAYRYLKRCLEEHPMFSISAVFGILGSSTPKARIQSGKLQFFMRDEGEIDSFYSKYQELIEGDKNLQNKLRPTRMIIGLYKLSKLKRYNHAHMIQRLKECPLSQIRKTTSVEEAFQQFREIYNFRLRKSNQI